MRYSSSLGRPPVYATNLLRALSREHRTIFSSRLSSYVPRRTVYISTDGQHEDYFRYTSGRWLWNENQQLRERYKRFNVEELKNSAAKSVGARSCVSMVKLVEGGTNKVFRLVMNDGSVVIARIPNPNAGPAFRTTASEVATMDFARSILGVPVPKVIAWDAKADNPVESEYVIMEEAPAHQLGEVWDDMELSDKLKVVDEIVAIEKKLLSVSFAVHGNLYFATDAFPGCEKAGVVSDTPLKTEVEWRYVIGPVVDRDFYNQERANMDIPRGPYYDAGKSPQEYLKSIAQREIAWISQYANPKALHDSSIVSTAQNSPEAHISLYKKFLTVCPHIIPTKPELQRSSLWHWDLRAANIFVDSSHRITSIIDWQNIWSGPLFLQARQPGLVRYNGPVLLELPDHYKDADATEKEQMRTQVEKSLALWTYETETQDTNPDVHEIFHVPHGRTRRETVDFAADTWNGDIIPFRQCLIWLARHFDEINSEIPCPITFTTDELEEQHRDGEGWNERAEFWNSLEGFVDRDGWTTNEDYEYARAMFRQLREQGLQNLTGEERSTFEERPKWAAGNDPCA